jgi:hypothetical protein
MYALYSLIKTIPWMVNITAGTDSLLPPTGFRVIEDQSLFTWHLMEYSGFLGLIIRVIAAVYALTSSILILKTGKSSHNLVRNKISKALLLEGLYYLSFIPAIYFLLNFSALPTVSNLLLSTVLSTQILLISPFLVSLSFKVKRFENAANMSSILRLAAVSSLSYIIAVWITYMLKWTEMMAVDPYLFSALSVRILGFLNTIVVQSSAVFFAVIGVFYALRKSGGKMLMRWWGLSLIFLSTHIILYVVYCASVGITRFIIFGELWVIPLFGLGAYLLLKNPTVRET